MRLSTQVTIDSHFSLFRTARHSHETIYEEKKSQGDGKRSNAMLVTKRAGAFVVVLAILKAVAPIPTQAKARILAIIDSVNGNLTALTGQLEAKVQTLIDSLKDFIPTAPKVV